MNKDDLQNIRRILLLLVAVLVWGQIEALAAENHIPEGISVQEEFKPGYGEPLGIFKKTVGKVLLIHDADTSGYWSEKDLPLYMKDTVITPEDGWALLQFLDESTISVAAESELIVNRFIFDPDKFDRASFFRMDSGKARFWVEKFQNFTRSEFKVKTKTLIAGVRGSDFVITAGPDFSEVVALDNTEIELVSLAAPDKVLVLQSFQKVQVKTGQEASVIEKVSPDEAGRLKGELPMSADQSMTAKGGIIQTEQTVDPDTVDSKLQLEGEIYQADRSAVYAVRDKTARVLDVGRKQAVLIPEKNLVTPEPVAAAKTARSAAEIDWEEKSLDRGDSFNDIQDESQKIIEDVTESGIIEDVILVPLPGLPGTP